MLRDASERAAEFERRFATLYEQAAQHESEVVAAGSRATELLSAAAVPLALPAPRRPAGPDAPAERAVPDGQAKPAPRALCAPVRRWWARLWRRLKDTGLLGQASEVRAGQGASPRPAEHAAAHQPGPEAAPFVRDDEPGPGSGAQSAALTLSHERALQRQVERARRAEQRCAALQRELADLRQRLAAATAFQERCRSVEAQFSWELVDEAPTPEALRDQADERGDGLSGAR